MLLNLNKTRHTGGGKFVMAHVKDDAVCDARLKEFKATVRNIPLKDEYDGLKPEYKQAGVKVQQIVLKVARADLDATVKAKADELVAKARGASETTTEEAFAELAKGNSEDPATAQNGGRVNGMVKKNPNKTDDPYQKVLDLQPGEVTDAIKYKNAYYILRRGESVPKTFEDAKPELLVSLRNQRGYTVAQKIAQRAQDRLKEIKDPQKVAQEFAAEANMSPADMVQSPPDIMCTDVSVPVRAARASRCAVRS